MSNDLIDIKNVSPELIDLVTSIEETFFTNVDLALTSQLATMKEELAFEIKFLDNLIKFAEHIMSHDDYFFVKNVIVKCKNKIRDIKILQKSRSVAKL
jgi:hypothetical protein